MAQQRGFVMADAMVALVLMSLLLVALLSMNRNSLELSDRAAGKLTAAMIAQSLLEQADPRSGEGEIQVAAVSYHWALNVRDVTSMNRPRLKLEEISVTISWQEKRALKQFDLVTARTRGVS